MSLFGRMLDQMFPAKENDAKTREALAKLRKYAR
jgi:hypothetical protein